ncbi:MAG: BadF/BadG/BcrA/BcrD ATPase family protein [Chloroflexota bacterium]
MQQADYVLGVDGGNTKTIALIARMDGTIAGVGRGGCSDIYTSPSVDVPLLEVDRAVTAALSMAGAQRESIVSGAFSLAGADWPEDMVLLQSAMQSRGLGKRITVVNDAVGALRAGSVGGPAVVVVCGTGAAIAARSAAGEVWHSSWWQEPQGGNHLGTKTLRAVYRAALGIDPPTALTEGVLRHFEQESVEQVLYLLTRREAEPAYRAKVSGLTRHLLDAAVAGDATAHEIAYEHGISLGDYALAAARRVGIEKEPFELVLSGGVLKHSSQVLPETLIAHVQSVSPGVIPVYSRFEPAVGALLIALEQAGVTVDEPLLHRLTATLPESSLFAT